VPVVPAVPPGLPLAPPALAPLASADVSGVPPDDPEDARALSGFALGGVGQPWGRGVPPLEPAASVPPSAPSEPVEPVEPAAPLEPPCSPVEPDGELEPDGDCEPDDEREPLDGEDGDGTCEPALPPLELDGLDELELPEDDGGIELGSVLDVVVLHPVRVTATATSNSVDKPWVRCICWNLTRRFCGGDSQPAHPTWMRGMSDGSLARPWRLAVNARAGPDGAQGAPPLPPAPAPAAMPASAAGTATPMSSPARNERNC
jgi:hypothetical protein